MTYTAGHLMAEVGYLAHSFHWSLDDILDLEHPLREQFVGEADGSTAGNGRCGTFPGSAAKSSTHPSAPPVGMVGAHTSTREAPSWSR